MDNRTPRLVSERASALPAVDRKGVSVMFRGTVTMYKVLVDGVPVPDVEIAHHPMVVTVLPFDRARRVVYMVEEPRLSAWLDLYALPHFEDPNFPAANFNGQAIDWDKIGCVSFPSGLMISKLINCPVGLAKLTLLETLGFDQPESDFVACGTFPVWIGNHEESNTFFAVSVAGEPQRPSVHGTERSRLWEVPFESFGGFLAARRISMATALGVRLLWEAP